MSAAKFMSWMMVEGMNMEHCGVILTVKNTRTLRKACLCASLPTTNPKGLAWVLNWEHLG